MKKEIIIGVLAWLVWLTSTGWTVAEPIAVIVHPDNSVKSLTKAELARIYKGQKTKWGNGKKIVVTNRPVASSIRAQFYKEVLQAKPSKKFLKRGSPIPFKTMRVKSDRATRKMVGRVSNAIGYVTLSQIDKTVKVLHIDGTPPSDPDYVLR